MGAKLTQLGPEARYPLSSMLPAGVWEVTSSQRDFSIAAFWMRREEHRAPVPPTEAGFNGD